MKKSYDNKQFVIFFDSDCLICNKSVALLYKLDKKQKFFFASFDSTIFKQIKSSLTACPDEIEEEIDSVVLAEFSNFRIISKNSSESINTNLYKYDSYKIHLMSTAVLLAVRHLSFPYHLFSIVILIPKFIRDLVYNFIAANRKKWFKPPKYCVIKDMDIKKRILD